MTKAQMIYLIGTILSDDITGTVITPLDKAKIITVNKQENLYVNKKHLRFLLDFDNEIMEVIKCKVFSETTSTNIPDALTVPKHNNYDYFTDSSTGITTVYEYQTDINGKLIKDYYDFDDIVTITLFR